MFKRSLLCTAGLAAIAVPQAAFAQDGDAAANNNNVIIVTATLREADVQDIPIAVTAINPEQLERQGISDIRNLGSVSSSFNLQSSQTETQGTSIRIRGVGTTGNNIGLESSVGVFIDGVYQSRPGVALGDLVDIERLEILRGPQGTLFGRNTSAGALNVVTRSPNLSEFEGFANVSYGNFDFVNIQGGISAPLVRDSLGARITGSYRRRDGYLNSLTNGSESNDRDRYVLRGQLMWEPTPNISLRIIGDYQNVNENCCDAVILRETEALPAFAAYGLPNDGVPRSGFDALDDRVTASQGFVNEMEQWGVSAQLNWDLGGVELTYIASYRDFSGLSRQDDFTGLLTYSVAGATAAPGAQPLVDDIQTWTQELRLQGSALDGVLDWLVGAYYSDEDIVENTSLTLGQDYQASVSANLFGLVGNNFAAFGPNPLIAFTRLAQAPLPAGFNPTMPATFALLPAYFAANPLIDANGSFATNRYTQTGESISIFTHNVINISDQVSLTLGARYVDETKDGAFQQVAGSSDACLAIANGFGTLAGNLGQLGVPAASIPTLAGGAVQLSCFPFATVADAPVTGSASPVAGLLPQTFADTFDDDELTYTIQLAYQPNSDFLLYSSFSHGFKSGGFNLDSSAAFGGADPRFNSEIVDSYELGVKADWINGLLRTNVALFHMDMTDFQVLEFTGVQFQTFNVTGAKATGVEVELEGRFTDYVRGNAAFTWVDARYNGDCDGGGTIPQATGLCGAQLTNSPRFSGIVGLTYDGPIGGSDWNFLLNGNVRYESNRRTSTNPLDGGNPVPFDIQEANFKVNVRFGVTTPDERFTFELWGTNIFDTQTRSITANTPLRGLAGFRSRIAFIEEPRMYGATIRARF